MPDSDLAVLGARLDPEDAYAPADVLEDLVPFYAALVAAHEAPEAPEEATPPAEAVAEYLLDTYEWDGEGPTPEAVAAWAEDHAEAVARAVPFERMRLNRERLLDRFHELRRQGKTVVQAAKKLGEAPHYLAHLAATDKAGFRGAATERALAARREHEAYRAAVARRRMLGAMATRLERELKARDLSDLPTKDLAHLLLKLAEVARDDEPPKLGMSVGFQSI